MLMIVYSIKSEEGIKDKKNREKKWVGEGRETDIKIRIKKKGEGEEGNGEENMY